MQASAVPPSTVAICCISIGAIVVFLSVIPGGSNSSFLFILLLPNPALLSLRNDSTLLLPPGRLCGESVHFITLPAWQLQVIVPVRPKLVLKEPFNGWMQHLQSAMRKLSPLSL